MTRVYADMVGDLFHPGHVALLRAARAMGDHLTVGVLSDATAESYKRVPVMTLPERVTVIEACRFVDAVIADAPDEVTLAFLDAHGFDFVVHGTGISQDAIDAVYGEVHRAERLKLVDLVEGLSTTAILKRVLERRWSNGV